MIARDDPTQGPATAPVTFVLERFVWAAPDRLELEGRFNGLEGPAGDAALVLSGPTGTHRLKAAPGDVKGDPASGKRWQAAFVWQEAPAAFDAATLELGADFAVPLPAPGADAGDGSPVRVVERTAHPAPGREMPSGADRLGPQAELLALREDLHEAQTAAARAQEELERARADLAAERKGRAEDAVRFRAGLDEIRASAQEALREQAEGAAEAQRLRSELAAAIAENEEALGRLETVRDALQLPGSRRVEG
jgi:hypothetical protein